MGIRAAIISNSSRCCSRARDRDVRSEDIEATIYSALGIDWTTLRKDTRFGRGFEYVPSADQDLYGPVHDLR